MTKNDSASHLSYGKKKTQNLIFEMVTILVKHDYIQLVAFLARTDMKISDGNTNQITYTVK